MTQVRMSPFVQFSRHTQKNSPLREPKNRLIEDELGASRGRQEELKAEMDWHQTVQSRQKRDLAKDGKS